MLLRMMSRSVRCSVGTGSSMPELMAARSAMDFRELRGSGALISGAALNCGGPLSRVLAALASLKLGVGELGGFTGSGTRRLGPPELFPEPGATPPAPVGAAALGSFEVLGGGLWGPEEGPRAWLLVVLPPLLLRATSAGLSATTEL